MKKNLLLFSLLFSLTCLTAQEWEEVAGLPGGASDARHHPITFAIDGYGYVLGGSVNGTFSKDFMRYEAATDTWETLPDFPGIARSFSYGTTRGTKAYIGFGRNGNFALDDFWEYDSETEEWTQLSDCACPGRLHPAFIQLDTKIYVGMGNNSANLNDWWEYDIPTDTWTQKDDLPGPTRHHPFYFGIGDIAYVGFGHGNNSPNGALNVYKDFYKFDPATDEWTQLNDFPGEARVAGTQFDYNGKGYVLSGDGDDHSFMDEGEFWEYDPETDEWTQLPSHPGRSRWAPGSFVIDDNAYLVGGLSIVELESSMLRFNLNPDVTSTTEFEATSIEVFPNPATEFVSFTTDITEFSAVRMVNSYGQVMQTVVSNQVDVRAYPSGIYYLQFFKGEEMRTEKITIVK